MASDQTSSRFETISRVPNDAKRPGPGASRIDDEARDQPAQIESAVEAISEGGEVGRSVLSAVEGMKGAGQGRLEIAGKGVKPSNSGKSRGLLWPTTMGE